MNTGKSKFCRDSGSLFLERHVAITFCKCQFFTVFCAAQTEFHLLPFYSGGDREKARLKPKLSAMQTLVELENKKYFSVNFIILYHFLLISGALFPPHTSVSLPTTIFSAHLCSPFLFDFMLFSTLSLLHLIKI